MKLEAQALDTERPAAASSSPHDCPIHFLLHLQKQFRRRRRYELSSCLVGVCWCSRALFWCRLYCWTCCWC
ncbi:hypothetical protein PF010_g24776 [Phytophthora fragariae]|uniref:Uncharacterized protein n=1 Tax=Phytophthora fragariae TaxID=53985 RepID=A0A6G0K2J8_9STRA|nr:hypothetical protein PF010_g24776 [Phytophthora fragariae]